MRRYEMKNALVTGGTDGIGKEVARGLAAAEHRLIIVGRDSQKGRRAADEIKATTGNTEISFVCADLSLIVEAQRLAEEVSSQFTALHCLVHSAGVVRGRRTVTAEGIEYNLALNYLSRFVVTTMLLPLLQSSGKPCQPTRMLIIGGLSGMKGRIYYDDVNLIRNFSTLRALIQFQHANDVFAFELARRLVASANPPPISVACLNPGVVKTDIRKEFPLWMKWFVPLLFDPLVGQTPQQSAKSALCLLLERKWQAMSIGFFQKIKTFKQVKPHKSTTDPQAGSRLFTLSEQMIAHATPGPAGVTNPLAHRS
jgi:NAD(P)-dependent dehydrogenase (short-subunit alcohol dehydrogenase family)